MNVQAKFSWAIRKIRTKKTVVLDIVSLLGSEETLFPLNSGLGLVDRSSMRFRGMTAVSSVYKGRYSVESSLDNCADRILLSDTFCAVAAQLTGVPPTREAPCRQHFDATQREHAMLPRSAYHCVTLSAHFFSF